MLASGNGECCCLVLQNILARTYHYVAEGFRGSQGHYILCSSMLETIDTALMYTSKPKFVAVLLFTFIDRSDAGNDIAA